MTITGHLRGHPISYVDDRWVYSDTSTPTVGNERDCGHCGEPNSKEGHDGCLGTLPGIMNACCGHGDLEEAYVQFSPGNCVRGLDAVAEIDRLKALVLSGDSQK